MSSESLFNLTVELSTTVSYDNDSLSDDEPSETWLKDVRFAIEGVTQLLVGIVGLIGNITF